MSDVIEQVRHELMINSDEKTKESSSRFFKEEVKTYGVKTAVVSGIARESFRSMKNLSRKEIFGLCEQLWMSGMLEESFIACNWAYAVHKQYLEHDFQVFERWVDKYVTNWASCDTLCNHTIGTFLEMYPLYIGKIMSWTRSPNRWVRRASSVSLIIPARKGIFKENIFEIADRLLLDPDDLVQKGYGWMLKSLCNGYEDDVYRYVLSRKDVMPRTALRYAIEKMPRERKQEAMRR